MSDATLETLNARPLPAWYDAAKFGIFIHWGMWAIPAFAPKVGDIGEIFATDYDRAITLSPYTEWYWNAIRTPGSPSAAFHRETFANAPYEAFRDPFLDGLKDWDPAAWARSFRDAGARYVVLVTKHHDGFCLWPSEVANPRRRNWTSPRDIVGEVADAVRAEGLKFGVYYSGGIDWTFNPEPLVTLADMMGSTPGGDYPDYAEAQVRELIARYKPSLLWNDISWPTSEERLFKLFADYYEAVPDGVVNDRWVTPTDRSAALRTREGRRKLDAVIKASIQARAGERRGMIPPLVPHSDFRTPEYSAFDTVQATKWEATRGMSHSFGFNRNDRPEDYAAAEELIGGLIDGAARNGGLLLNVGPRADGDIPDEQLRRLAAFGDWLERNGAAIYGARPWSRSDGETVDRIPVRFTVTGDRLNLVFFGKIAGDQVVVRDLAIAGPAWTLGDHGDVGLARAGDDTVLTFANPPGDAFAPVVSAPLPD